MPLKSGTKGNTGCTLWELGWFSVWFCFQSKLLEHLALDHCKQKASKPLTHKVVNPPSHSRTQTRDFADMIGHKFTDSNKLCPQVVRPTLICSSSHFVEKGSWVLESALLLFALSWTGLNTICYLKQQSMLGYLIEILLASVCCLSLLYDFDDDVLVNDTMCDLHTNVHEERCCWAQLYCINIVHHHL